MTIEELQRQCVAVIRRHLPDERWQVWLFGSQAAGRARPGSDLDLALVGPTPVPWRIMARIHEEVDELPTLRSIDVVDVACSGERLRQRVLKEGRKIA